ncbi:MAG: ferrochelatase [Porticoccaceae bacterium]|nr:ferrochelatase [Porticoccaceae bacterium]
MPDSKSGVILVNLGTPESPTAASVRRFLREFLSDPRVIDAPRLPWKILLNTIILPLRSRKVARAYASIWTEQGSPLRKYSQGLAEGLCQSPQLGHQGIAQSTVENSGPVIEIVWAMTYGEPSIESEIEGMLGRGIDKILVLPLYPQFSSTTTGAVYDRLQSINKTRRNIPDIRCVHDYHDEPFYIEALASSVTEHWHTTGKKQKLLMSFHGLPESYVDKGDPYIDQCKKTACLLAEQLELNVDEWAYSFQSRFGPANWVKPYTDETLVSWAQDDVQNVDVICPSFATDCLETLEEVGLQYRDLFRQSGGAELLLMPCLNSTSRHITLLEELIIKNTW